MTICLFGQNSENEDQLCVINRMGAKVYESPSFNSKIIAALATGEKLVIDHIIQTDEELKIGNGFSLPGNWIKPSSVEGYVFSSDVTDKAVEVGESKYGHTFINFLVEFTNNEEEETIVKTETAGYPKNYVKEYYKNGTITYTKMDGCTERFAVYTNLTLSEVYHQMISDFGSEITKNDFKAPQFQTQKDNFLLFNVLIGPVDELKIKIKENGVFTISSHTCI
jgi:hypothetical protein